MTETEFELEVEELFEELLFEFNVFTCPDEFEDVHFFIIAQLL